VFVELLTTSDSDVACFRCGMTLFDMFISVERMLCQLMQLVVCCLVVVAVSDLLTACRHWVT